MPPFLLTASTSTLAIAVAHHLVRLGHDIITLARDPSRATELPQGTQVLPLDLSDPVAIDALDLPDIAGIMHLAGILRLTADPVPLGFPDGPDQVDRTWATNVLGPLRLVRRFLPHLPDGAPVCLVSGNVHRMAPLPHTRFDSSGLRAAAQAATTKVLWTRALARHRPDLVATTFCPGRVRSDLHRGLPWPASWLVGLAALTGRDAIDVAPELVPLLLGGHPSGTYQVNGVVADPAPHTDDEALQDAVWGRVQAWAPTAAPADAPEVAPPAAHPGARPAPRDG